MNKASRNWTGALIAALGASIVTAGAQQFPTAPPPPPPTAEKRAAPPPGPRPSAAGPAVAGIWSGTVAQADSQSKYSVVLTITAKGGETDYPELNCGGKLTRIGASRSYVFFVEVITRGQIDKGGRCPDGTITVARSGDNLAWGWFGSVQDKTIVASGTLTKRPAR